MKILLATDGSDFANEAALKCGELFAECDSVHIKIITVIDNFTPMATEPFISPEEFLETVEKEMRESAQKILSNAEKIIKKVAENTLIESEILMGSAKKVIVDEAETWNADLIVVGSHSHGFLGRTFLGSISDAVVHHSTCSVLVVKKSEDEE